ncbi:MAG: hypothetical protein JXA82_02125 [Sedimentisphaerales bacterium]|nr:hypothetical protein [Sedimentisphaerales bacterium]
MNKFDDNIPNVPDPEIGDEKEVYSFYGLAAYNAQVVEKGLLQLAILLHIRVQIAQQKRRISYDQVYDVLSRRTFGQILKDVSKDMTLSADLRLILQKALKVRNYLIHQFFWDYAEYWFSDKGRLGMIRELQDAIQIFSEADHKIEPIVDEFGKQLGLSEKMLEEISIRLVADAQAKYDNE